MIATNRTIGSLRHRRQHTGFTLIEMAVVTALSAVLLGVVVSLALGLLRWDRLSRTRGLHCEQRAELAELLRTDIRHGTDAVLSARGPLVLTSSTGEQIRYELETDGCRRTKMSGGHTEPRIDLLTIGGAKSWKIEKSVTGRRPLILVTLERTAAEDPQTAAAPLLVQAEMGADLVQLEHPVSVAPVGSDPADAK